MWFGLIIGAILIVTATCICGAFIVFDRLLRHQHSHHPDQWIRDGRPIGFFWIPPGAEISSGSMARSSLAADRLFATPEWIRNDKDAAVLLTRMRFLVYTGWVGALALLPITLYSLLA